MAITKIDVEDFFNLSKKHPVIDVRSEGEYAHAHIPGSVSLPLFNNEERKVVGTAYKQQSRKTAIKTGLDYFGKKMTTMVEDVEKLVEERNKKKASVENIVLIHCWRGGMRSGALAWLLDLYGFKVYALVGGYKAFRNWVLNQFERDYNFLILGGYTGSGKTYILNELKQRGEYTIDLEHLANHKGSSFGNIGLPAQPSQEMFENMLAVELDDSCKLLDDRNLEADRLTTNNLQLTTPIWLEDESKRIGSVNIPASLWNAIRQKPVYFLEIDFEERLDHIVDEYGKLNKAELVNAIIRIQKKLGGLETKNAINFLVENDVKECFRILLTYYDKQYLKGLNNHEASASLIRKVDCKKVDPGNIVPLLKAAKT